MPDVVHRLYYSSHDSLVVDRKLLHELISSAMSAGWKFSDCDLKAKKDREVNVKDLDHLSNISAPFLETVESLTMWFHLDSGDRGFITLESFRWFAYGKPFRLSVTSANEGAVLALKSQLLSLLHIRRQWYSGLSRGLWYWIVCVSLLSANTVYGAFHHSVLSKKLNDSALVVGLITNLLISMRSSLFPAVEFNLAEFPPEKTASAKLRKRLSNILFSIIGTAVVLGLVAAALKRILG